jgi:hypothetical protein
MLEEMWQAVEGVGTVVCVCVYACNPHDLTGKPTH